VPLGLVDLAPARQINLLAGELHAFFQQHFFLFRQPGGVTGEAAVRSDHAVAGYARRIRVFVHRVADGAIPVRPDGGGEVGIRCDFSRRDSAANRPDFLVEAHRFVELAGQDRCFDRAACVNGYTGLI